MTPTTVGVADDLLLAEPVTRPADPDALTTEALVNCLVREVSMPEGQVWPHGPYLLIRLARVGRLLRVRQRRPSAGVSPRLAGDVTELRDGSWRPVGWDGLAGLIAEELSLCTGNANDEFAAQVGASHAVMTAVAGSASGQAPALAPGEARRAAAGDLRIRRYLASEQALVAGHRFHPAPKARAGRPQEWLRYAPEAGAGFPLHFLAVRADVVAEEGDVAALDRLGPAVPAGFRLLPAHPWQLSMLAGRPRLRSAMASGLLHDLGPGPHHVVPTSSVRTVYDAAADLFCKFSLDVRITNCVRRSAWYELTAAAMLTSLLGPVFAEIAAHFPGTVLLGEPGYRTASLADRRCFEGLAVIVRDGLRTHLRPGVTPLLAAALTEPRGTLFDGRDPGWLMAWWEAYLHQVAPPALHAYLAHGVVLEPHLQNVLIGIDDAGQPVQVIFRDLEGVKLLAEHHGAALAALPPRVAQALTYGSEQGWNRVVYCLVVNHLAELAAAIADRQPGLEAGLWRCARSVLDRYARGHGCPPPLRALLAGVPLPAKANLRTRWARAADRHATYVHVPNPLGAAPQAPAFTAPCAS
ncbi:MAG TPA: IucA/IucC family protein [Streptosporangiaceae bacterium]|nr:IucA/IucC family protein [Streptosporangiaceae bacterium]